MKPSLSQLPITLNPGALSVTEGVRAGSAVALVVVAGAIFGLPYFGLAALGALLTCFADPGGPVPSRARGVLSFAVLGCLSYGLFGLVRAEGIWIAAPLAGLAIFATSFARIYGQGGLQVGNLLSVVIVLALDTPANTLTDAALRGLNFFVGALWAALITLALWQIHPYAPARRALADVANKLSALARDLIRLAHADEGIAAFEAHAALHRRLVRESIEASRNIAMQTFRRRGVLSRRATQLSIRLQTLEQVFSALIALSEILESLAPAERLPVTRALRLIGGWLAALGPDIVANRSLETERKQRSLQRLRSEAQKFPETSELRHVLEAVAERLAVLVTASANAHETKADPQKILPLRMRILSPIRANFSFRSAPLRHALRAACVSVPVLGWTMSQDQPFAHWMTITMVLCLQPYFSATWVRVAERVTGTVLGGMLAAALGLVVHTKVELAVAMLPLTVFAFSIRGVSFTAFVAALTPMIVLLIEQIAPGVDELTIALSRIGYTVLGGVAAVLANVALWPGFEAGRLDSTTRAAINAHAIYARAVFAALLAGGPVPDPARRNAGVASNNLEASLSRALLEPHRRHDAGIERGAVVDAALRRMAGRLSVLVVDRPVIAEADRPLWQDWQAWLAKTLETGGKTPRPELPPGPAADALSRLARQAELIAP